MDYIVNGISSSRRAIQTRLVIFSLSLSRFFSSCIPIYVINNNYTHKRAHKTSLKSFQQVFFLVSFHSFSLGSPKGQRRRLPSSYIYIVCFSDRVCSFVTAVSIPTAHIPDTRTVLIKYISIVGLNPISVIYLYIQCLPTYAYQLILIFYHDSIHEREKLI